jgi:hypothetical protein
LSSGHALPRQPRLIGCGGVSADGSDLMHRNARPMSRSSTFGDHTVMRVTRLRVLPMARLACRLSFAPYSSRPRTTQRCNKMNDPVIEKLNELLQRLDTFSRRLDELERLFKRYVEVTRGDQPGVPPPPPARVN